MKRDEGVDNGERGSRAEEFAGVSIDRFFLDDWCSTATGLLHRYSIRAAMALLYTLPFILVSIPPSLGTWPRGDKPSH